MKMHKTRPDVDENAAPVKVLRFDGMWGWTETQVAKESLLTIYLNGERIVSLICSPSQKEYLAIGFLAIEGLITPDKAKNIKITQVNADAIYLVSDAIDKAGKGLGLRRNTSNRIMTPGLGKGVIFTDDIDRLSEVSITAPVKISPEQVFSLMEGLTKHSTLHKMTHGVHNSALCTPDKLLLFHFDLGRHNAIDKIYGQCLTEGIDTHDKLIVTSGRVSSEIVMKTGIMGVPILISRTSPTERAINLARDIGLTLIARVRNKQMFVYSHDERIIDRMKTIQHKNKTK